MSEQSPPPQQVEVAIATSELPDKVCTPCLESNLIKAGVVDKFQLCPTCTDLFCIHGASNIDPKCCIHCCNDFKVVDVEESIVRETHDDSGVVTSSKHYRVRRITLSGYHWLFYNRKISEMTDAELDHAIEYHHAIFNGMLAERDARRVAHFQRNRGKRAGNESRSLLEGTAADPLIQTGEGAKFKVSRTTTRTTRTRTIKTMQSGTPEDNARAIAEAALQQLLKAGMSKAQIESLFKK